MNPNKTININNLRRKIVKSLKGQGFIIDNQIKPENCEKEVIRNIHIQKRQEQLVKHKTFLFENIELARKYSLIDKKFEPEKINLKLIEVKPDSKESKLFLWWNLVWWSLPFDRAIGRQMRFMVWDSYHDSPFGLIGLQSPPLASSIRDKKLGLHNGNREFWINQSLYAQRLGAIPPYNELLGGKMIALSLTSNEIRKAYSKKYHERKTILKDQVLPNRLLFITTTSAYGKSSVYERIKYYDEKVGEFLGLTSGAGTFQLSEKLYQDCLKFLEQNGYNIARGYGTGPSRKLKLTAAAFRILKIKGYEYHNVQRGMYLFPLVKNLQNVIQKNKRPLSYNRSFNELSNYWLNNLAIPRSERIDRWRHFNSEEFFSDIEKNLENM